MYRYIPLIAVLLLTLGGCGRQSDTHDPAGADGSADETITETMEESVTPPDPDEPDTTMGGQDDQMATTPEGDESEVVVCSEEWFGWVNDQVLAMHDGDMADLYPGGLPEVGSEEWFLAIDKLTGGDGAHGPDGGSAEWCAMIQQRLQDTSP
ncbi:hypothetical protein [Microbulbifer litoralis]|uniref:hypothetical protein n=1 Tax=Microbulbifer litoralis TaxID=2933965 RepID=UPI002027881B|nr:hypothetical protein [Microbulbifer sp. GX H0434]